MSARDVVAGYFSQSHISSHSWERPPQQTGDKPNEEYHSVLLAPPNGRDTRVSSVSISRSMLRLSMKYRKQSLM